MKNSLLGGLTIAATLLIQSAPASAQGPYGAGHPRVGHSYAGHGPARSQYQYRGYARGQGPGYGVGAGVAAVAAGALIGGAIASQNQGYYPAQDQGYYPAAPYQVYSDSGYGGYNDAGPVVYNEGDPVAYCEQTYRSYDPTSGTYLGYDGFRHPCP
jgi:BA14K-like protein